MREAVLSSGRALVYPLWLASPLLSGSPLRVTPLVLLPLPQCTLRSQPVAVTVFHGIAPPPWMRLKSAARRLLGTVRPRPARPCSPCGFGVQYVFPLVQPATVVLSLPLRRPWAVRFFSFVEGSLLKGFFAPVRFWVGFLRVWLSYAFLPLSLGWWLVCG